MKYIFRISGHQIPTEVQQTTLTGKATAGHHHEKPFECYALVLWVKTILWGWQQP